MSERSFSFEFYPPKTAKGRARLERTVAKLGRLDPAYFSVTFGAGGSTQSGTLETVLWIHEQGFEAAPHISCIGTTREQIREMLERYEQAGITRLVALRGDLPSGMVDVGDFRYANELVAFIREETGDHFTIEVAAYPEFHPQAPSPDADMRNFRRKVQAGADAAITQYFFNPDAYFRFVEDCRKLGVDVPIVPGVMPIINFTQLARFSDMCGAEIPRWLRLRLQGLGDDKQAIRDYGVDVTTRLCEALLDGGAPGIHFYTLNQAKASLRIWENLGLPLPAGA